MRRAFTASPAAVSTGGRSRIVEAAANRDLRVSAKADHKLAATTNGNGATQDDLQGEWILLAFGKS
jgi:hypothetical protein